MKRWLVALFRAFLRPTYVETKPTAAPPRAPGDRIRRPRPVAPRPVAPRLPAPTENPLVGFPASVRLDDGRPHTVAGDGLLLQRAEVDLLLADGRMSRLGVLAAYDPITREPRRISYIPIHAVADTEVVS